MSCSSASGAPVREEGLRIRIRNRIGVRVRIRVRARRDAGEASR